MERKRKGVFNNHIESDQTTKKRKKFINQNENTRLHNGKYTLESDEEQDNSKEMNQDDLDGKKKK